jgi:hypothetical protein
LIEVPPIAIAEHCAVTIVKLKSFSDRLNIHHEDSLNRLIEIVWTKYEV